MTSLRLLIGIVVTSALGLSAMACRRPLSASRCALGLAIGLALAAPMTLVLALLGLPSRARVIVAGEALLAVGLFLFRRGRPNSWTTEPKPRTRLDRLSLAVLGLTFLTAAVKWYRAPLWSWDHFAIWGIKARRIVQDGMLDFGVLRLPIFAHSATNYPVGLPLSWRVLSLSLPEEFFFKTAHALFALGLILLVRGVAFRASRSLSLSQTFASLVCVSPLFWDTESLGLADLPLIFFAVASIAALLEARASRAPAWVAGWVLGFVSWIKTEGTPLSLLLLAFGVVLLVEGAKTSRTEVARRLAGLLLPALLLIMGSVGISRLLLAPTPSFFSGDWSGRIQARLHQPAGIVRGLAEELLRIDWWGFWPLLTAAFFFCLFRRKTIASLLLGIVFIMLTAYATVYFATFLDPVQHLENSFFRISAALVPLGVIGVSFLFEDRYGVAESEFEAAPAIA